MINSQIAWPDLCGHWMAFQIGAERRVGDERVQML